MKITAWRICKARFAHAMFAGTGARTFGGRWNSKGVAIIYTSATLSLAAMELLVHLDDDEVLQKYIRCQIAFDESLLSHVKGSSLPRNWRALPPPTAVPKIGDSWANNLRSAVLAVPSTVVEGEWNYLLNPAHPDFSKIKIGKVEPFRFDRRLA